MMFFMQVLAVPRTLQSQPEEVSVFLGTLRLNEDDCVLAFDVRRNKPLALEHLAPRFLIDLPNPCHELEGQQFVVVWV